MPKRAKTLAQTIKTRTKKEFANALNPSNYGHYHFGAETKATLASIYRNQAKRKHKRA